AAQLSPPSLHDALPIFKAALLTKVRAAKPVVSGCFAARRSRLLWWRILASAARWAVHSCPAGFIVIQSTGQGATHSSQPEHRSSTTVCIHLLAPTIASRGQAWIQSVQPIQCSSLITATLSG